MQDAWIGFVRSGDAGPPTACRPGRATTPKQRADDGARPALRSSRDAPLDAERALLTEWGVRRGGVRRPPLQRLPAVAGYFQPITS